MTLVIDNVLIFDGTSDDLVEGHVVLADGLIQEVESGPAPSSEHRIDAGGRFLMPGLIDLHFHAYAPTLEMGVLDRMPPALLVSYAHRHLTGALQRGFTTVRDPGGGDIGLAMAIERRLIHGPRFLYGGKALSQTGGHGDMRPATEQDPCACAYSGVICQVVDGVDEVRRAARDELRKGADHIKVFISGGIASPTDPIWMPQFTDAEIQAAVEEATSRRKYVVAHCHTNDGAQRCVRNGVRSIDHGTHITDETARLIAESGTTYVVPTLVIMSALRDHAEEIGLYPDSRAKVEGAFDRMLASIEALNRAGAKVGLGTDLFGDEFHVLQSQEMRLRGEVDKPIDVLRSATSINAEIVQRPGEIGCVVAGAAADLLVLESNPLMDLSVFERHDSELRLIVKGGIVARNALR